MVTVKRRSLNHRYMGCHTAKGWKVIITISIANTALIIFQPIRLEENKRIFIWRTTTQHRYRYSFYLQKAMIKTSPTGDQRFSFVKNHTTMRTIPYESTELHWTILSGKWSSGELLVLYKEPLPLHQSAPPVPLRVLLHTPATWTELNRISSSPAFVTLLSATPCCCTCYFSW